MSTRFRIACSPRVTLTTSWLAGRAVSATHEALGAIRVMPPCFAMGEAAGVASALAQRAGLAPRDVDVSAVQAQLKAQGACIGDPVAG